MIKSKNRILIYFITLWLLLHIDMYQTIEDYKLNYITDKSDEDMTRWCF